MLSASLLGVSWEFWRVACLGHYRKHTSPNNMFKQTAEIFLRYTFSTRGHFDNNSTLEKTRFAKGEVRETTFY